jgi:uncharacterized protein YecE (DUF72 family)
MAKIYVGMSGWTFDGWRGDFYPKGLSQKKELEFASQKVNSIEINGTFYSLQKPASFQRWYDETPEHFCFSVKAPQYITHIKRLKDVDSALANFLASGLLCLKEKLGPILWQFPPNVTLKDDRFEKFFEMLPHNSKDAARVAQKHTDKVEGRAYTKADGDFKIRHAFEFRHPSFQNPEFIDLMRKHNVAVVFAHSGLKSPYMEDLTSDFIYARMHGQDKEFKKGYDKKTLEWWTNRVSLWTQGRQPADAECISDAKPKAVKRDAFIYFDDEAKEYAPYDAMNLIQRLEIKDMMKTRLKSKRAISDAG